MNKINFKEKISKLKDLVKKIKDLLDEIYLGEKTYNKITNKLISASKIFIVSTRKFTSDCCPTKASSIAYTALISLIPTLTVVLTFYSIFSGVGDKKEEIFNRITSFILEHNIKLNIDPIIEALSSLIENAGKIGGIGAIIMIFSATALLRTLEQSLNDIWLVEKSRSLFMKIIFYWAALSLGPIIVISGTTLASQFTAIFSSPHYNSADISNNERLWVVGDKSRILYTDKANIELQPLSIERIDFDNQKVYKFDNSKKTFMESEFKIEEMDFNKTKFSDIQFINNNGWITGKNGLLLNTRNNGKTWSLYKFGSFSFNDIHMIDSSRGFIAADNGYMLSTTDGGRRWDVREWKNIRSDLNSIAFYKDRGIICGDSGIILTTADSGNEWETKHVSEAKTKKRYINLNSSFIVNDNRVVLVGNEGIILFSDNSGKTWKRKKFMESNYYSAYFTNTSTGFITGEKGILISTNDGGKKWQKMRLSRDNINMIISDNKSMWVIGDMGMVKQSAENGKTWDGIEGGNFVVYLLNFITPFISIWLLFLLIYIGLPNMKIPFKSGAIGAAFTSLVWVMFLLLYNIYVKSFAKGTFAIYGALAAIPLFLLLVYLSSLIILYGAEVSYTLMHPHTYLKLKKTLKEEKEIHLFYGIAILYQIYNKFEIGKGSTTRKDLLKVTSNREEEINHFVDIFKNEKLIIETEEENLIPANSSKNIIISDIISLIHDVSLIVPKVGSSPDQLKKYIETIFNKMKSTKKDIVKDISLGDIIEKAG